MDTGARVRMSEELRAALVRNGCEEHVAEFGGCVGTVVGPFLPGAPEVDVRWSPSGLRYAYHLDYLEIADDSSAG